MPSKPPRPAPATVPCRALAPFSCLKYHWVRLAVRGPAAGKGAVSAFCDLAGRLRGRSASIVTPWSAPDVHRYLLAGGSASIVTPRRAPDVHRYLLAGGSASIVTLARGRSARTAAACQEGTISRGARRDGPPRDGSPRDGSPRDGRGGAPRSTRRTRKRQGFRSGGPYHKAPPPTILPDPQAF